MKGYRPRFEREMREWSGNASVGDLRGSFAAFGKVLITRDISYHGGNSIPVNGNEGTRN